MLERGYHATGVQDILTAAAIPRGSFYHHFSTKEDFALQLIDAYAEGVHQLIEATLHDTGRPPLDRIRGFFALVREAYKAEGYLGCFLGALGQELSSAGEPFRRKIEGCLTFITDSLATCFEEARTLGDIAKGANTVQMAEVLVDAWEGAALRSRLARTARPLEGVVDFYLNAMASQ